MEKGNEKRWRISSKIIKPKNYEVKKEEKQKRSHSGKKEKPERESCAKNMKVKENSCSDTAISSSPLQKLPPKPPVGKRVKKVNKLKQAKTNSTNTKEQNIKSSSKVFNATKPNQPSNRKLSQLFPIADAKSTRNNVCLKNELKTEENETKPVPKTTIMDYAESNLPSSRTKFQKTNDNICENVSYTSRPTGFHLSLNESTLSFLGNSSNGLLDMSSGLTVSNNRPDYNFHISIDDSTELNKSAALIRDQIFDLNNEWNVDETTPGRYNKITTHLFQNPDEFIWNTYHDSLEDSLSLNFNESDSNRLPENNPASTRMSFLFNEFTGLICKHCFSSDCHHMDHLSSVREITQAPDDSNNLDKQIILGLNSSQAQQIEKPINSNSSSQLVKPYSRLVFNKQLESNESESQLDHLNVTLQLKELLEVNNHIKVVKMDEVFHRDESGEILPFNEIELELSDSLNEFSKRIDDANMKENNRFNANDNIEINIPQLTNHVPCYNMDYSNNALRFTPTLLGTEKLPLNVVKRNSFMSDVSNDSRENLYYDSDYDDASYLNGCLVKTRSSFERLDLEGNIFYSNLNSNANDSAASITPPLKCSSPTEVIEKQFALKRRTSLIPSSSLTTVIEEYHEQTSTDATSKSSSRYSPVHVKSDQHQPIPQAYIGQLDPPVCTNQDKNKPQVQVTSEDKLNTATVSDTQRNTLLNGSSSNNFQYEMIQDLTNSTINDETIAYFINRLENECNVQENVNDHRKNREIKQNMEDKSCDDNLTINEIKKLAHQQLTKQQFIDQGGTENEWSTMHDYQNIDVYGNDLDSEDELQWFLQEKRKKMLNSDCFSSGNSDVLPEDEEVRQINLPATNNERKISMNLVDKNADIEHIEKIYVDQSTSTDDIGNHATDLGSYKHIDILVLNTNSQGSETSITSNPSGIDSGVDSRSSLTSRSCLHENAITQAEQPATEERTSLTDNVEQQTFFDILQQQTPSTTEQEQPNNQDYLMNHFLRQQSNTYNQRQNSFSYYRNANNVKETPSKYTPLTDELSYINKDTPLKTPSILYRNNLRFLSNNDSPTNKENYSRELKTTPKTTRPESMRNTAISKKSTVNSFNSGKTFQTGKQPQTKSYYPRPPTYSKKDNTTHIRNFNLRNKDELSKLNTKINVKERDYKKSLIQTREIKKSSIPLTKSMSLRRSLPRITDYNGLVIQGHDIFKRKRKTSAAPKKIVKKHKETNAPVLTAPYRAVKQRGNFIL